jgi:hypothetical protein
LRTAASHDDVVAQQKADVSAGYPVLTASGQLPPGIKGSLAERCCGSAQEEGIGRKTPAF